MLWDQRVVGSNPISPTTNPTVSATSASCDAEQTGNDWKHSDAIGRNSPGIVPDDLDDSEGIDFREVESGSALDQFHFELWGGMISFLLGQDEVRQAFEAESGHQFALPPRNALDRMIDEACGRNADAVNQAAIGHFVRWATENYWGDESFICPAIAAVLNKDQSA